MGMNGSRMMDMERRGEEGEDRSREDGNDESESVGVREKEEMEGRFVLAMGMGYREFVDALKRNAPRILLVGDTGTGKSSLVNLVFGSRLALVGHGGRPCTQHFAEFGPTDESPVRIIDSKGVEKLTVDQQMEELRTMIAEVRMSTNLLDHIHLVWYFVGSRWQESDQKYVVTLLESCGVVLVINKRDLRSNEEVANLRQAITEDFPGLAVAECGDPRESGAWIPQDGCPQGHDEEFIVVNVKRRTWHCRFTETVSSIDGREEVACGASGNDQPFGAKELVELSLDRLPAECRKSFLCAQRVDLTRMHIQAAGIITAATATATVVGAAPLPFSDMPPLVAIEAGMIATLMRTYNVPFQLTDVLAINTGALGLGAGIAYAVAQALKASGFFVAAGMAIDMTVAGTAVMTMGISVAIVCARCRENGLIPEDLSAEIHSQTSRLEVGDLVNAVRTRGAASVDGQIAEIIRMSSTSDANPSEVARDNLRDIQRRALNSAGAIERIHSTSGNEIGWALPNQ